LQAADVLGVTPRKVRHNWTLANAWLLRRLLAELAGSLSATYQTLNSPGGRDPKYVPGQTRYRHWRQPEFSWFFKNDFKVSSSLTLNLGMRYDR